MSQLPSLYVNWHVCFYIEYAMIIQFNKYLMFLYANHYNLKMNKKNHWSEISLLCLLFF